MTWSRFSLRARIFLMLTALVLTTLVGGSVTMMLIYRMGSVLTSMVDKDIEALNVAQELETALVMQKGYLTYYFLDSDPAWLEQLDQHRNAFEELLRKARETSYTETQRGILNEIESKYIRYSYARDQVIDHYKSGDRENGLKLHRDIRKDFFSIRDMTDRYMGDHARSIALARADLGSQVKFINTLALLAMPGAVLLGLLLAYVLFKQVLQPIRQMATGTGIMGSKIFLTDEVKALSQRVQGLIKDVDQAHNKLKWSRQHLLQSEKLAQVGKLAAGVAHSIRNPLTSVKMRLFSLERSLDMSRSQKEDFEVISEEIRHIDTIVRNFLEFSRPPKLKMQMVNPSDVVDMALQLLKHRLESYGVEVQLNRVEQLPEVLADSERLKEVFVNLMANACEAMSDGGLIVIEEEWRRMDGEGGDVVLIRVSDNGPGIPESLQDKVFQPFFSTKEEGTGLGLSIAARIVEEHEGALEMTSREGEGTCFEVALPCR